MASLVQVVMMLGWGDRFMKKDVGLLATSWGLYASSPLLLHTPYILL